MVISATLAGLVLSAQPAAPAAAAVVHRGVSYSLGRPAAVGAQIALQIFASPDGASLAVAGMDPAARIPDGEGRTASRLDIFAVPGGKPAGSWPIPPEAEAWAFHWTSAPGRAVLKTTFRDQEGRAVHRLRMIRAGAPAASPEIVLNEDKAGADLRVLPSPSSPFFIAIGQAVGFAEDGSISFERWHIMKFDLDGRLLDSLTVPRETTGFRRHFWRGSQLLLEVNRQDGRPAMAMVETDGLDLAIVSPQQAPARPDPILLLERAADGWRLKAAEAAGSILATRSLDQAVLPQRPLFVAYLAEDQAFIRPILSQPADAAARADYARQRRLAERSARDVGQALRQYWRDNSLRFPPKEAAKDLLERYLRWVESLDGLTVQHLGGRLNLGEDTARTVYGWVQTPYGRAAIMLDGTVVWQEGTRG